MHNPEFYYELLNDTVMISGIPRSGTSLLGKVIGSFKNFEYEFEPPLVNYFNALLKNKTEISSGIIIDILTTYFVEDIIVNYLHGRKYNFRYQDDSCIFNMKSYREVMERLGNIENSAQALELLENSSIRFSFKSPGIFNVIPLLFDAYGNFKLVDIKRNLYSVVGSMVRKKWCSDEKLNDDYYNTLSPYYDNSQLLLTYHIEDENEKSWKEKNEVERVVKLVINMSKNKLKTFEMIKEKYDDRIYEIKYENLLKKPDKTVNKVSLFLNVEKTNKTLENINKIRDEETKYNFNQIKKCCNTELYKELKFYNKKMGYKTKYINNCEKL